MTHTRHSRIRHMIVVACMTLASAVPGLAHAQFDMNKLSGKKFEDVKKILGTPILVSGNPVTYSRFKTSGAIDTMVWYSYNEGMGGAVGKVMVYIPAKPGETAFDAPKILKRYNLTQGSNIKIYVGTKLPSRAMVSVGKVPGMPWKRVYISYKVAQTYKPETMKYCKEHHLDPTQTFFWTVMVRNAKHWKVDFGKD